MAELAQLTMIWRENAVGVQSGFWMAMAASTAEVAQLHRRVKWGNVSKVVREGVSELHRSVK